MKKFLSYIRVSTDRQGESGLGIDAQREAVKRYLNDAPVLQEFVEIESGRRHKNRPKLLAALEQCKKQRATLVIAKLDRLGRNVAFISALMESGVDFICCDNPHANRLMLHIIAAFAEHEREVISARTREAMQRAKAYLAQHGSRKSLTGRVYTRLGSPRIEEAGIASQIRVQQLKPPREILTQIAQLRGQGLSFRAIADRLNAQNIRTTRGYAWYASTVRSSYNEVTKARKDGNTIGGKDESVISAASSSSRLPEVFRPATPSNSGSNAGREPVFEGNVMGIEEAKRMIDVFTSVGARSFVVTKTDINQRLIWGRTYSAAELYEKLPAMLSTAKIRKPCTLLDGRTVEAGENLIIRPTGSGVQLIQLDDLNTEQLTRVRPVAFIIHETSPGNHQAWLAVSGISNDKEAAKDFVRRVRKAVEGNDKSASHATRIGGSENFKAKYAPNFPTVTITEAVPGRVTAEEDLAKLGLIAAPERVLAPKFQPVSTNKRPWPSYEICLMRAPRKADGTPDRSKADMAFCLTSLTGGRQVEETIARLNEVSDRAKERQRSDPGYARVTVENAAKFVAQNYGKSRSRA